MKTYEQKTQSTRSLAYIENLMTGNALSNFILHLNHCPYTQHVYVHCMKSPVQLQWRQLRRKISVIAQN